MVPAGKPLPFTFSEKFATGEDSQKAILITLAQKHSSGTEKIATITIDDLPPKPRGVLLVIVTFTVNTKKELRVKATSTEANLQKEYGPFSVR